MIVQELSSWIAEDLILPTYTPEQRLVLGNLSPSIHGSSSSRLCTAKPYIRRFGCETQRYVGSMSCTELRSVPANCFKSDGNTFAWSGPTTLSLASCST